MLNPTAQADACRTPSPWVTLETPPGSFTQVEHPGRGLGQRHGLEPPRAARPPGRRPRRPGRWEVGAGVHGVAQAQLDRVHALLGGQPVHLGLVGEAGLDGAEPAHGLARRVVGGDDGAVDGALGTS